MYIPIITAQLSAANVAVPPEAAAHAAAIVARLSDPASDALPRPSDDPRIATLELMEAIREVGTCYVSAPALAASHLPALLRAATEQHADAAVRKLAQLALACWRRIALQHLRVLVGASRAPAHAFEPTYSALGASAPRLTNDIASRITRRFDGSSWPRACGR